ncbi:MAG: hypothetical protein IPH78_01650 [Bacteroidetes bacterium]|nr:hypothetical protein [Bacteroidota bacterium]MBK8659507.1 hypothetical protein [Bacteroidota bacterium]
MKNIFLLFSIAITLLPSCKKASDSIYKIEYSIGCSDCMVAYTADQQGNQISEYHKSTGWTYTFNAKQGQQVLLMAYNTSSAPQGVTSTIKLNDEILETRTTYCPISGVSFCVDTIQ